MDKVWTKVLLCILKLKLEFFVSLLKYGFNMLLSYFSFYLLFISAMPVKICGKMLSHFARESQSYENYPSPLLFVQEEENSEANMTRSGMDH